MKAYQLIEKPENWTQKVDARDISGLRVNPNRSEAISFCILGATGNWTEG